MPEPNSHDVVLNTSLNMPSASFVSKARVAASLLRSFSRLAAGHCVLKGAENIVARAPHSLALRHNKTQKSRPHAKISYRLLNNNN